MSIIEVKFKNNQVFLQKEHDITLKDYEKQILKIRYNDVYENYRNIKDINGVENEMFPPVNFVFYSYLFYYKKVPDTLKIIDVYFKIYKNYFITEEMEKEIIYNGKKYNKDAIIARILRTYPSLIRDFHFYLLLIEDGSFDDVIYSCKADINGKDIIIHNNNKYPPA